MVNFCNFSHKNWRNWNFYSEQSKIGNFIDYKMSSSFGKASLGISNYPKNIRFLVYIDIFSLQEVINA